MVQRLSAMRSELNAQYASVMRDRSSGKPPRPTPRTDELDVRASDGYIIASNGEVPSSEAAYLPPSTFIQPEQDKAGRFRIKRARPPPPRRRSSPQEVYTTPYFTTPTLRLPGTSSSVSPSSDMARFEKLVDDIKVRREHEMFTSRLAAAYTPAQPHRQSSDSSLSRTSRPSLTIQTKNLDDPPLPRTQPMHPKPSTPKPTAGSLTSSLASGDTVPIILFTTPNLSPTPVRTYSSYGRTPSTFYTPYLHSSNLETYSPRPIAV